MSDLRRAAQNVVDVWNRYRTVESLRGWMEILENALKEPVQPPCDIAEDGVCETLDCPRCGKLLGGAGHIHTCTPKEAVVRKEDPVTPSASLARCLGRVAQGDVEFAWQLHPECELCLRRAPIPRGGTRVPHISPWYGSGTCPDRVVEK